MKYKSLEIVVLENELKEHGLQRGDTGTVVEVYEPNGVDVEFMAGDGGTKAVVTLFVNDVRHLGENDILAVRSLSAT